jgi:hypothetical protein
MKPATPKSKPTRILLWLGGLLGTVAIVSIAIMGLRMARMGDVPPTSITLPHDPRTKAYSRFLTQPRPEQCRSTKCISGLSTWKRRMVSP